MTTVITIETDRIRANPWQPRRDVGDTTELAKSIEANTLLQLPMGRWCCTEKDGPCHSEGNAEFVLAFGHRRFDAVTRHLDWKTMDVILDDLDDQQMVQYALAENRERVAVEEIDELEVAVRALEEVEGLKQQTVAAWMGWSRTTFNKRKRVLMLPEEYLDQVRDGKMSVRAGCELLAYRGADGHVHEDLMKKAFDAIYEEPTVDKVQKGVALARPRNWVAVDNVDNEHKNIVHRMRVERWGTETALYCCDTSLSKRLLKEAQERVEAAREEKVQVFRPLVDLDIDVVRMTLSLLRPSWQDADLAFYEAIGIDNEDLNYANWTAKYDEWVSGAPAEALLDVIRWKVQERDKEWNR